MFNKKHEADPRWRSASSPFRALIHCAGKEEAVHRKLQKARRAYIKERIKQHEHLNREVAGLDKLLKEKSIDEDTCGRLKKLLEMGYELKRQETREKYGFAESPNANRALWQNVKKDQ